PSNVVELSSSRLAELESRKSRVVHLAREPHHHMRARKGGPPQRPFRQLSSRKPLPVVSHLAFQKALAAEPLRLRTLATVPKNPGMRGQGKMDTRGSQKSDICGGPGLRNAFTESLGRLELRPAFRQDTSNSSDKCSA